MENKMKSLTFLTTAIIFLSLNVLSQNLQVEWYKTYGGTETDYAKSVYQTSDSGYIIAGGTQSFGAGLADVWILKTNSGGDTLWSRIYGGEDYDHIQYLLPLSDGGFLIAIRTYSFGNGQADIWLVKIDKDGNEVFSKTIGDVVSEWSNQIIETPDSGFVLAAFTNSFGNGGNEAWLIKTNSEGDTIWTKTYGGSMDDVASGVCPTFDNGFLFVGRTSSFGAGGNDVWIIKTDENGDSIWTKVYGGIDFDVATRILPAEDNTYLILGETQSFGNGMTDFWIIKIDEDGNKIWDKTYGSSANERPFAFIQVSSTEYLMAGSRYSDPPIFDQGIIIKIDNNGEIVWSDSVGGSFDDWIIDMNQTNDGGYIIGGSTCENDTAYSDLWLVKFKPEIPVSVNEKAVSYSFVLNQNYPNPFNPKTTIGFGISEKSNVKLSILNLLGEEIKVLLDGEKEAGYHSINFNSSDLPSGVYFYQLKAGDPESSSLKGQAGQVFVETKKMLLIK
jgi:predicted secreted protein